MSTLAACITDGDLENCSGCSMQTVACKTVTCFGLSKRLPSTAQAHNTAAVVLYQRMLLPVLSEHPVTAPTFCSFLQRLGWQYLCSIYPPMHLMQCSVGIYPRPIREG